MRGVSSGVLTGYLPRVLWRAGEVLVWTAVLTALWVVTVSTPTWQEILAAVVFAVPCAFAARAARRAAGQRWRVNPTRLRWLAALPGSIVTDTATVVRRGVHRDDGYFDRVTLAPDSSRADKAVAMLLLSATPGTVVTGVDDDTVLVHRLSDRRNGVERQVGP